MDLIQTIIAAAAVGVTNGLAAGYGLNRWLRGRADAATLEESQQRDRDVPRSLYPLVDPDLCIGSLACIRSCPEGDVLGVVDGVARLVRGQECIGHGRCAAECPVSAITLVFGTAKRGIDLPEVDEFFESSRPGVHVVGELGGMGLIKNAMRQGLQVGDHLASTRQPPALGVVDVCIVGAGPAGLATGLALAHHGLTYRLVDQQTLGGTITHYPRRKVVMTEAVHLPGWGRFGKRRMYKEELLELLQKVVRKAHLNVEEGVKVEGIEGQDGDFTVVTTRGPIRARKVVLAVGRRGSPRKLGVPGEEREKVVYRLDHPEQYDGTKVLVVGAGDSGVEAACQLARESQARVWLSFRGESPKCREPNRREMEAQARRGRLETLPGSKVTRIGDRDVTLAVGGREVTIPNDFVIVNVGGELPTEFLAKAGVSMRRYHAEPLGGFDAEGQRRRSVEELETDRKVRGLELALAALGAVVLAVLAWRGWSYYLLPAAQRVRSPLHAALRPAGTWGHGVGVAATAFMLSNFLYVARKRIPRLTQLGNIRAWLALHVFAGFMSPLVIAFHAAFQSRNLLASSTTAALVVVVVTGIVGRYIFSLVPTAGGRVLEVEELQRRLVRARTDVEPLLERLPRPGPVKRLFATVTEPPPGSLVRALVVLPLRALRSRAALRRVARLFPDEASRVAFRDDLMQCERLRVQIGFYRSLKALMRVWRVLHAATAAFLVLAIAAHVAFTLYLGYGLRH